jgi:VanZ family protein
MIGTRVRSLLRAWLPVALWIGVIALESTDMMSARNTGSFLYAVLQAIFGPISRSRFEVFHHLLRKSGHFVGYGILAIVCFRALRATLANGLARLWCGAMLLTCLIASLDEWHQSFIPSRTASVYDVALDTVGGLSLLLLAALWTRRKHSAATVRA